MTDRETGLLRERVVSIDALRGLDMFFLIGGFAIIHAICAYVQTPLSDAVAAQLKHTQWHGFHFVDLVFPLFLFLVGASMAFSFEKRRQRGDSRKELYLHVVKRTALLFFLGLVYNGLLGFDFSNFHYTGVLQRIAVSYFLAALIVINTGVRGQAIAALSLLLTYWALMTLVPVPGHGAGVLTPDGSLAAYIDQLFLPGRFHRDMPFDEDGILSQIPSTASVLMGTLAGHLLKSELASWKRAAILFVTGAVAILVALVWDGYFPIIFRLWTSSYAMLTAGISAVLLSVFYWIIDVRQYSRWAFPLVVIGLNPLTIYVAQRLFDFRVIADVFVHGFIDYFGDLKLIAMAIFVFAVKWLFLYFLYRQKIFLRA